MKILLTAVNAKYIHSNLGIYSLKAYADQVLGAGEARVCEVEVCEAGGRNAGAKNGKPGHAGRDLQSLLLSWPSTPSTTSRT